MFCGMVAVGLAFSLFYYLTNNKQPAVQFKKDHPLLSLALLVMSVYFIVYLLGSVIVFLLGILLPILGKFSGLIRSALMCVCLFMNLIGLFQANVNFAQI